MRSVTTVSAPTGGIGFRGAFLPETSSRSVDAPNFLRTNEIKISACSREIIEIKVIKIIMISKNKDCF